jgi:hypothetical protein
MKLLIIGIISLLTFTKVQAQTQPQPQAVYKLTLELNEVNYLLQLLQERPYKESSALINKILEQAKQEAKQPTQSDSTTKPKEVAAPPKQKPKQ